MSSKQKRKLTKRKSSESQNATSTSVDEGDESADTSTLCSADGGEKSFLKRQEFICSTAHNAHLQEDYLEDKSQLFGRQLSVSKASRNVRHNASSKQPRLKHVHSELLQRKSYPDDLTNDTRSLQSVARLSDANKTEPERKISSPEQDGAPRKRRHREPQNVVKETPKEHVPEKPPRKTRNSKKNKSHSLEADTATSARAQTSQTSDPKLEECKTLQELTVVPQNEHELEAETSSLLNKGGILQGNPRVIKRNSSIRPLRSVSLEEAPKVYQRRSLTNQNSFSRDFDAEQVEDGSTSLLRPSVIHPEREISSEISLPVKPLYINGRFQHPQAWFKDNREGSTVGTWRWFTPWDLLVWKLFGKNNSAVPSNAQELNEMLPIYPLEVAEISTPPESGIRVTWLGHSSLIVQFDGLSILTDPVFSEYTGPMRLLGVKRIRKMPGTVHDLPIINAVVISHNHYDHLDKNTVVMLNARFGCSIHWFVPFGLAQWMRSVRCTNVTELTWWEEGRIPLNNATSFVLTPAQHWSGRGLFDRNKSLWGSWSIIGPRHRFFFAGDTGYCSGFKQIGEKYGPFDLAAIPVGVYDPRWILSPQHVDPERAVQIHLDVKAKRTIGIHWGTFIMSNEHYLEPPKKLSEAAQEKQLEKDECFVLSHGESKLII